MAQRDDLERDGLVRTQEGQGGVKQRNEDRTQWGTESHLLPGKRKDHATHWVFATHSTRHPRRRRSRIPCAHPPPYFGALKRPSDVSTHTELVSTNKTELAFELA